MRSRASFPVVAAIAAVLLAAASRGGLAAVTQEAQLQVGTSALDSDVVVNGTATAAWTDFAFQMDAESTQLLLYMHLSAGKIADFAAEVTASNDPERSTVSVDRGETANVDVAFNQTSTVLTIDIGCLGSLRDNVTLTISSIGAAPTTITFHKACKAEAPIKPVFLSVGSANDGVANLVRNGTFVNETIQYSAGPTVEKDTFYVWSSGAAGFDRFFFDMIDVASDRDHLNVTIACDLCLAQLYQKGASEFTAQAIVTYDCLHGGHGDHLITAHMRARNSQIVAIQWQKTCPKVGGGGGGGGWSSAGVFFFVVFILVLVGLVLGALFKYFQMGVRGIEVIPFIDTCRSCAARAAHGSAPKSGPQDAYGEPLSGYGSTDSGL